MVNRELVFLSIGFDLSVRMAKVVWREGLAVCIIVFISVWAAEFLVGVVEDV